MKILCHCGETIFDQADNLPRKAQFIPDQEWFVAYDGIDDEIIDPVADGRMSRDSG